MKIVEEMQCDGFRLSVVELSDGRRCTVSRWSNMSDEDVLEMARVWGNYDDQHH